RHYRLTFTPYDPAQPELTEAMKALILQVTQSFRFLPWRSDLRQLRHLRQREFQPRPGPEHPQVRLVLLYGKIEVFSGRCRPRLVPTSELDAHNIRETTYARLASCQRVAELPWTRRWKRCRKLAAGAGAAKSCLLGTSCPAQRPVTACAASAVTTAELQVSSL